MPALKDNVNETSVRRLAAAIEAVEGSFPVERFAADALDRLGALELKQRIEHVAAALGRALPLPYPSAAEVVQAAVGRSTLGMWEAWPAVQWAGQAGSEHPAVALPLLASLTSRASAEFAIRPFIDADPARVRRILLRWTASSDEHVRRLVSEGTRPRLPWARRIAVLEADPDWAVPLLDRLYADASPFVRRSVANHLNDLGRIDPELALATAARWAGADASTTPALVRHGLRTLVKAGDAEALRLLGADVGAAVRVDGLQLSPLSLRVGDVLEFVFELVNDSPTESKVVVDYAIHHVRARATTSRKVFKLRSLTLAAGERRQVHARHSLVAVTTRRHYPGLHRLDVQCNGTVSADAAFELTED